MQVGVLEESRGDGEDGWPLGTEGPSEQGELTMRRAHDLTRACIVNFPRYWQKRAYFAGAVLPAALGCGTLSQLWPVHPVFFPHCSFPSGPTMLIRYIVFCFPFGCFTVMATAAHRPFFSKRTN